MTHYRLIILRKSLLVRLLSDNMRGNSTGQYCCVEFPRKLSDKSENKRDFWKIKN